VITHSSFAVEAALGGHLERTIADQNHVRKILRHPRRPASRRERRKFRERLGFGPVHIYVGRARGVRRRDLSGAENQRHMAKTGGSRHGGGTAALLRSIRKVIRAANHVVMRIRCRRHDNPTDTWTGRILPAFPERNRTKSSISYSKTRVAETASKNLVFHPPGLEANCGLHIRIRRFSTARQEQRVTRRGPPAFGSSSCAGSA